MKLRPGTNPAGMVSRRSFLKASALTAGGFVLGFYLPLRPGVAFAQEGQGMPAGSHDPNTFVKISTDNTVTIISKYLEMGQGVTTGVATLIAEELGADWSRVRFELAPNDTALYTNLVFGIQGTGGSTSMLGSWQQMRSVGAAARMMFVAAAARSWGLPEASITVETGMVRHTASGRQATLGALAEAAMREPVPEQVQLKSQSDWNLIGQRLPRLDSKEKTDGSAVFAFDIRRDGMLTAVVQRAPRFGSTVKSFDDTAARRVPGVVNVVQVPSGVAILAQDTWSAMRGRDALKIEWDDSQAELRSTAAMTADYREQAAGTGLVALTKGNVPAALSRAATVIEAEFVFPFLAHAPMETLNGVMELSADGAEVWAGSQLQTVDTQMIAHTLGLDPSKVKINTLLSGGSFGRRGNPAADWTVELATIVKAHGGTAPVHLVWTREDDIRGGYYRPMALHQVRAGVDASGQLSGWQHKVVSKSIFTGTAFADMLVHDGLDASTVEGVANTPYAIGDFEVLAYNAVSAVPVMPWRSVGNSHTGHAMETVVDELAHAAGKDPVEFRAQLLAQQPRDLAVVRLAAAKAGWGETMPKGKGRGIAYHMSFGTRVALVADVAVTGSALKIERIVAAVDCGIAINPDVVAAQIEGAIGFALSTVVRNAITLDGGTVQQSNYHDFQPTRINEMPSVVVHIVPSEEAPSGIGEPGLPPLAPAIGNAIFAATGKRLRSLPLDLKELHRA